MESMADNWKTNFHDYLRTPTPVSVFVALVLVLSSFVYYYLKNRGLPPGPIGLPILGYWPFLKNETIHLQLFKLQEKYGDIFSFSYAGALHINMGSIKAVREFHVNNADHFERCQDFSLLSLLFQDGTAFIRGERWKAQRKFALQQFKELGMTTMKDTTSGPMYDVIQETVDSLRAKNGEPMEVIQELIYACNSIVRKTLFGDFGITKEEMREINESYSQVMSFMSVKNSLHSGNLAKYFILPFLPGYSNAQKHRKNMERIITDVVERHKSSFDGENTRNFIDAYYKERDNRRAKGDPTADYFTDKSLISNFLQSVGDGVVAVAAFVAAFLKYAVEHQEEQEKIFTELIEVVGPDRSPTIEDKSNLPYTNAFILEVLRVSEFFPMFPCQQCIKETTVRGYRIPKGAITLMNTWNCHFNPDVYEEPEAFNPSRFLAREGKPKAEMPVTFGLGRRNCIGEGFTMTQVFLFLTTIIKNFKLIVPEHSKITAFELLMSGKIEMCALPRN